MTDQVTPTGQVTHLPGALYRRALEVGRRAAGATGPNPPVGCLIVRDGAVIAEGATEPTGGRHAEVVALSAAGERARGSIAVVTLEPCAHHGRTPPCTDALLAAGVSEVHVLLRDPDPVATGGLDVLARSGVATVEVGSERPDLRDMARHDLRGFLARVAHGRPHVTLKLAQAPDGSTDPGADRYLTSEAARRRVHELRAESDAVLVGGATVRTDDPRLDVRHVATDRQPRPVILTERGDIPLAARVVRDGAIIVHGPATHRAALDSIAAAGVRLIAAPLQATSGGIDLPSALTALLDVRVLTVLAEPGPRLAGALIDADLVDVVELHVAGGDRVHEIRPALPALAELLSRADTERTVTPDGDLILRSESAPMRHAVRALEGAA